MTVQGVKDLYMWLSTAWPLVIKPGAPADWQAAKCNELYKTFRDYRDDDVQAAFQKWTLENERFPTTKNIINEIKWAAQLRGAAGRENEQFWDLDFIKSDGTEWTYGAFRRSDFVNHPWNPDHLQPEDWERLFRKTRNRILNRLAAERRAQQ